MAAEEKEKKKTGKNTRMRWLRWVAAGIAGVVALLLLVVLASPLWLPWVAKPVAERFGATWEEYERIGYARFGIHELEFVEEGVRVRAEYAEGFTPVAWVWRRFAGEEEREFAEMDNWVVAIEEREDPEDPEDVSVAEIIRQVEDIIPWIIDWAPRLRAGDGRVVILDHTIEIPEATWRRGLLAGSVRDPQLGQEVSLEGDFRERLPYALSARSAPFPAELEVNLVEIEEGVGVRTRATLLENVVTVDADFPPEGHLPRYAVARADEVRIPQRYLDAVPESLRLGDYGEVTGSFFLEWEETSYAASIEANAPSETGGAPLKLDIEARGNLERVRIDKFAMNTPWVTAELSAPVLLDYKGNVLDASEELAAARSLETGSAVGFEKISLEDAEGVEIPDTFAELLEAPEFAIETDLAALPFIEMEGRIFGQIRVVPHPDRPPEMEFSIGGEAVRGYDISLSELSAEGGFAWPRVRVREFFARADDGSEISGSGGYDTDERRLIEATLTGLLRPGDFRAYIPEGIDFSGLEFSIDADGVLETVVHEGEIKIEEFSSDPLHPIDGRFVWEGIFDRLDRFEGVFEAGESRLILAGEGGREEDRFDLGLERLTLERDGERLVDSMERIQLLADWSGADGIFVALRGLDLQLGEGGVQAKGALAWPARGDFQVRLHDVDPSVFHDFIDIDLGVVDVRRVEMNGGWDEGPLLFTASGHLGVQLEVEAVAIDFAVSGQERFAVIEEFTIRDEDESVAMARGRLPVALHPGTDELLRIYSHDSIELTAETNPRAGFWGEIVERFGIGLEEPTLRLTVGGTLFAPEGELIAGSPRIGVPIMEEHPDLVAEEAEVRIGFDLDEIALRRASVLLEGERIEAAASIPMGPAEWRRVIEGRELPNWRAATGHVRADAVELEHFTRFAPGLLTPEGVLHLDLRLSPGPSMEGTLAVDGLGTRPLPAVGSIREGTLRVEFEDRVARIDHLGMRIGGEPITIEGTVDLPIAQELGFDIRASGQRVPFTRQPGMVIRGDFDLRVASRSAKVPLISGNVRLRDSLYLAEIGLMPTGSVTTPDRRPPFFSVEQEPFGSWELDVELRGPRFLAVHGPIFEGVLSAGFDLGGTLEEPVAIGEATIDEGTVRFPFAMMRIDQAVISLTPEQPFEAQLFILASATAFDYDVQMEISGTSEQPTVEFSSSPPLTSQEILLMVTAGEIPHDSFAFTSQQRASRFAMFVGRQLMAQLFGVDTAEDRLTIRSGERISEGGRETFSLEYKLTDRWSVTGEYDRFDEYNAGLKLNVYSR